MKSIGVAESALRQVIARARERDPKARLFAVKTDSYDGKPTLALDGGEQARVLWCPSVLEFRQRLVEAKDETVVLVTPCDERELGEDAIGLVARGRLERLGEWEPIKAVFKAREIHHQVRSQKWLPQALLQHMSRDGYEPAPSGVLTYDHALKSLTRALLGVSEPSGTDLLKAVAHSSDRISGLDQKELLNALGAFHGERLGPFCASVFAAASHGHAAHVVAIGLAARVIFGSDKTSELAPAQQEAMVRLERFTGGVRVSADAGRGWANAAERLLSDASANDVRTWMADAERLVDELGVASLIGLSSAIPAGLSVRRDAAVAALRDWLEEESDERRKAALDAIDAVRDHRLADQRSVQNLEMSARLIQFAHSPERDGPMSLGESARRYVSEGGPLDRCREVLDGEFRNEAEKRLVTAIAAAVDPRRERRANDFAQLLAAATEADRDDDLLVVERVLPDLVAPLASVLPVLLIVLDGMSEAAFQALSPSIAESGWTEASPDGKERKPTLAVLPSITTASRASLLSGTLSFGSQRDENTGFQEALRDIGEARLFHRAELRAADELREVIADHQVRVVGVVVNAIDDMLDKGDQVAGEWNLDRIGPLRGLLDAASESGRGVVVASDHGHVIERNSDLRSHSVGGARWRPVDDDQAGDGEILVKGRRVVTDEHAVIVPVTERLRYRSRSSGYHGGATPQEVIAPVAVFLPPNLDVPGFEETIVEFPEWWHLDRSAPIEKPKVSAVTAPPSPAEQEQLFGANDERSERWPEWVSQVLTSSRYKTQRERAHRPPSDDRVALTLSELDRRGGVADVAVLAGILGVAPSRGRTVISSMQALLNVDGYGILTLDSGNNVVQLDRELLRTQFEL